MLSTKFLVVAASLAPFLLTVTLYFSQYRVNQKPSEKVVIYKVLPILCLVVFVSVCGLFFKVDWKFWILIALGLVSSSAGDAFLVYDSSDDFLKGMVSFAVAHIFYTIAFGFTPVRPLIGLAVLLPGIGMMIVLVPKLTGILKYGVPVYGLLLVTMVWRMLVRVSRHVGPLNPAVVFTAIGSISWALSDSVLAYNQFHSTIKYAQIIVMITYYIGQLGVSLSIFNENNIQKLQ